MRTKTTSSNLFLYAFLGLLFGAASTVDFNAMASKGMDNQRAYIESATQGLGQ